MPLQISLQLTPKQASDSAFYVPVAARKAGVPPDRVALARVVKRSVDARSAAVKVNLTIELFVDGETPPAPLHFDYPDVGKRTPVIIIGAGPAGLFAALRLIELGLKPVLLERGRDVGARKRDIALLNRGAALDPDSNYAFGEGGAGTFSDGKLFTRSKKRGDYNRVLQVLCFHGAQPEILYDAHPHIGTDRLPRVISALRETITSSGGEIYFNARATAIEVKDGRATGVRCGDDLYEGAAVILAAGHSARDVYKMLHAQGVALQAKPFAVGVRVEHPQALIDSIQYHMPERGEYLPAASYSLVSQVAGRGVYSFCMCPGGFIVPAMTSPDEAVVNGMSPSGRNSVFANSGIVTEVRLQDVARYEPKHGALAGLAFQEELESAARRAAGEGFAVPGQRLTDFVAGRISKSLPRTSYNPGAVTSDMHRWMPSFVAGALRGGFTDFGRKMRGFVTGEAMVLGVESRTSSPVRIPRDEATFMHPSIEGLFPAAEGAGYAGGIVSAALDGERVAEKVACFCRKA